MLTVIRYFGFGLGCVLVLLAGGCASVFTEGSAAGAGVAGAAIANAFTKNGAVTAGIGLGAQAAALAGVQYVEKRVHTAEQDEIAQVAGTLAVGTVAPWHIEHDIRLEANEAGDVTVSRTISAGTMDCKEIVFSVDTTEDNAPRRAFYTATICRDGSDWKWASAEPATERWGSLQ